MSGPIESGSSSSQREHKSKEFQRTPSVLLTERKHLKASLLSRKRFRPTATTTGSSASLFSSLCSSSTNSTSHHGLMMIERDANFSAELHSHIAELHSYLNQKAENKTTLTPLTPLPTPESEWDEAFLLSKLSVLAQCTRDEEMQQQEQQNERTVSDAYSPIQEMVFGMDLVETLIQIIDAVDRLSVRAQACGILCNISACSSEMSNELITRGAMPVILKCFYSHEFVLHEIGVWTLGNVLVDSDPRFIRLSQEIKLLESFSQLAMHTRWDDNLHYGLILMWSLRNLCAQGQRFSFGLEGLVPGIARYLQLYSNRLSSLASNKDDGGDIGKVAVVDPAFQSGTKDSSSLSSSSSSPSRSFVNANVNGVQQDRSPEHLKTCALILEILEEGTQAIFLLTKTCGRLSCSNADEVTRGETLAIAKHLPLLSQCAFLLQYFTPVLSFLSDTETVSLQRSSMSTLARWFQHKTEEGQPLADSAKRVCDFIIKTLSNLCLEEALLVDEFIQCGLLSALNAFVIEFVNQWRQKIHNRTSHANSALSSFVSSNLPQQHCRHMELIMLQNACFAFSNICCGSPSHIQHVMNLNLLKTLHRLFSLTTDVRVQREICYVFINTAVYGSSTQQRQLVEKEKGIIVICEALSRHQDVKLIQAALQAIYILLEMIQKYPRRSNNNYAEMIEEHQGLLHITRLTRHKSSVICSQADSLLRTFFEASTPPPHRQCGHNSINYLPASREQSSTPSSLMVTGTESFSSFAPSSSAFATAAPFQWENCKWSGAVDALSSSTG